MEQKTGISVDEVNRKISVSDLEDMNNLPRGFNRNVQGFKKVAEYINNNREKLEKMTMYSVINELDTIKDLRFHTYCAMD